MEIKSFIRLDLLDFQPYTGANLQAEIEYPLHLNESSFPRYYRHSSLTLNRYPTQAKEIESTLAAVYQVAAKQCLLTAGGDEAIDIMIRLCCTAGVDNIMICPPTFPMYAISARIQGAGVIKVPLLKDQGFALDIENILLANTQDCKLIFICSPGNPTASAIAPQQLKALLEQIQDTIIVLDEAYIEFSQYDSFANVLNQYPNLVIVRTLSKAHALAGARVGCLLANPELINYCRKVQIPFSISSLSLDATREALTEPRLHQSAQEVDLIKSERKFLSEKLAALPCVKKVWPSDTNFLLVTFNDAKAAFEQAINHKILCRNTSDRPNCQQTLRITVGLPEENEALVKALSELETS